MPTSDNSIDSAGLLQGWLGNEASVAVALSGGVDSMTLAAAAHASLGRRARMYHAVSPAVPSEATERVTQAAQVRQWQVTLIDAGELRREAYLSNPVNRCFYCKSSLYEGIAPLTDAQIVSGTNTDDLGEYRPGLKAAERYRVRHPFVELGFNKRTVRAIARALGLGTIAELPAGPCLASRIETGIRIEADLLELVHGVERMLQTQLCAATVRCRIRATAIVVELDSAALATLSDRLIEELSASIGAIAMRHGLALPVNFAPYRNGSAFLIPAA